MFGKGHNHKGCKISPMQMTILVLLRDRPMYGYEVLKELRDHFEGLWIPKTGSIYPSLKRLEEHGLITSEKREGTDYYAISGEGREWVVEELSHAPRDIRMFTRYLEIIGRAADEVPHDIEVQGHFSEVFEGDPDDSSSRRAAKLRAARERIAQHLADIDRELQELDSQPDKGGQKT
jgi:DNA-binding PadR family transcriptional regulator